ncbi:MAG: sigma-70 family RNA polymerase sigma factor [Myxococcota bacterium]|nr:sigma-70 family RNA polymerase sigma factor [Myxococcota bacterium]
MDAPGEHPLALEDFVHEGCAIRFWKEASRASGRRSLVDAELPVKSPEIGGVAPGDPWLGAFHAGDRKAIERSYREHYRTVAATVGRLLSEADAETVTHEVFYRLLSNRALRENFEGGNFVAWLTRVARNSAIDHRRRYARERSHSDEDTASPRNDEPATRRLDDELEAKRLIERFCRECLPVVFRGVFDARFLRHLSQRAAAAELGMRRTTLAYQEGRVRALLVKFLLRAERS